MLRKKRYAVILVAALVLAVAVAGIAGADPLTSPVKNNYFQDFLAKFSSNLGVDQEKVSAALDATRKQMLDEAVQQGRLTQEQADKIAADKNGKMGWFGDFHVKRPGRGEIGLSKDGRMFNDNIAAVLGITMDQLKSELESGKKLNQIITDHGLTLEQFNKKMVEIKKEALSKAVSDGKMTQEQADRMLQRLEKPRFEEHV